MVRQLSGRLAYLFSVFQSQAPGPADWSRVAVSPDLWTVGSGQHTHTHTVMVYSECDVRHIIAIN